MLPAGVGALHAVCVREQYPMTAPEVCFLTKINHPNIDKRSYVAGNGHLLCKSKLF